MDVAQCLQRIESVPSAAKLATWARGVERRRLLLRCVVLSAGQLALFSPAFADWVFDHLAGFVLSTTALALVVGAPFLLARFVRRRSVRAELFDGSPLSGEAIREAIRAAGAAEVGAPVHVSRERGYACVLGSRIFVDPCLLECLTAPQLTAVLAHEVGHWKERFRLDDVLYWLAWLPITIALLAWLWPDVSSQVVGVATIGVVLAAAFALLPSFAQRRWREHLADLEGARRAGAGAAIGALLKLCDLEAARLERAIGEIARRHQREASGAVRARLVQAMGEWRARLTSPTYVPWREFDANRNGEIEPDELRALLAAMAPWPALHLDVSPAGERSTHPGVLERILFLLREAPGGR